MWYSLNKDKRQKKHCLVLAFFPTFFFKSVLHFFFPSQLLYFARFREISYIRQRSFQTLYLFFLRMKILFFVMKTIKQMGQKQHNELYPRFKVDSKKSWSGFFSFCFQKEKVTSFVTLKSIINVAMDLLLKFVRVENVVQIIGLKNRT